MSTHRLDSSDAPNQPAPRDSARIACLICEALYVPAPTDTYLLQASSTVLESAFMSMCHFCFRCRRPACPGCWDDVHGVCGTCALETHLPFRSALAPLQGSLFATTSRAQIARVLPLTTPLVCVRPGHFQRAPLPIDTASTVYLPVLPPETRSSKAQPRGETPPTARHSDLVPASSSAIATAAESNDLDIAEMVTRPEPGEPASDLPPLAIPPARSISFIRGGLERSLTTTLLLLLLSIAALIVAVLLSPQANVFIINVLHIDIRAELTNLWQLIRRIHF